MDKVIAHVTWDWKGERFTLVPPSGPTIDVTSFRVREDPELRAALKYAHTVAFIAPEILARLQAEQ